MRSEHLKFFLNLVQTGSILQSSQELYTTHQNVSKMIRQLENELGTTLFIRSKKGVQLTATGKLLLPVAQQTVALFTELRTNITMLEKEVALTGELHILSSDLVSFTILSSLIHQFSELYPALQIRLENTEPLVILQKIALHPQMVGVVVILNNSKFHSLYKPYLQQIQLTPLLRDNFCCVVGPKSPLYNNRSISLDQFSQHPFATTTSNEEGENILTNLLESYGGTVSFSTNSISSYNNALLTGRYVGISSRTGHRKSIEENIKFNQLHLIPFEEDMSLSICLAINQHAKLNEAQQSFVSFMQSDKTIVSP